MLRLAGGDGHVLSELAAATPSGHAVEARVYAEDTARQYRPSPGRITEAVVPDGVRVDTWVEAGTEVTAAYDPLLAKVVAWGRTRDQAFDRLGAALAGTRIGGIETNLGLLASALDDPSVRAAVHTTATLAEVADPHPRIEVLRAGTQTTVQAWPGRLGYWHVGRAPVGTDGRPFLPPRQPGARQS